jgi:hypothetical protein
VNYIKNGMLGALILALIPALIPTGAATQSAEVLHACYVPATGTVYRIATGGLPADCTGPKSGPSRHVRFSWTDGAGAVRAGDAAGGDLSGEFPDPTVVALLGRALATTPPTAGQVLAWDAAAGAWTPVTPQAGVTDHAALTGLSGDDHTQYLLAEGVRHGPQGFAVTGQRGHGGIPGVAGEGTRLMWYPGKAAFRAGYVFGQHWDDGNVGQESVALGSSTTASGYVSTAFGQNTEASGAGATAFGQSTVASGITSTAFGHVTRATSLHSFAIGQYNVSSGSPSGWNAADPLFMAGNGTSDGNRSNALTLYKSGDLTIAGRLTATGVEFPDGSVQTSAAVGGGATSHGDLDDLDSDDHAQYLLANGVRTVTNGFAVRGQLGAGTIPTWGGGIRMMWYPGKAAFRAGDPASSFWDDAHVGEYSAAFGRGAMAKGNNSMAFGSGASATGFASTAWGSTAVASGTLATAFGLGTLASSYASLAIGRFNESTGDESGWNPSDPLFMAGNGTSTGTRSNALTLYKSGDLTIAGALTATGVHFPDGSVQTTASAGGGVSSHADLTDLDSDDHTQYLLANGVRASANGFAVTGTVGSGAIPVTGNGTRMMWYPGKAAFRAGETWNLWDDANVGLHSTAFGDRTLGAGAASFAAGRMAGAQGAMSAAFGDHTTARAMNSFVIGRYNVITGDPNTWNPGDPLFVAGNGTPSASSNALTLLKNGDLSIAGQLATTGVRFSDGSVLTSASGGSGISAHADLTGLNNDDHPQYLLASGARTGSHGFAVSGTLDQGAIPASGAGTRLMWYPGRAAFRAGTVSGEWDAHMIGRGSAAFGSRTTAFGSNAVAFGHLTRATNEEAAAWGWSTLASGPRSTAFGYNTLASGHGSVAMGDQTQAAGYYAVAMGRHTQATTAYSLAIGQFNISHGFSTGWNPSDMLIMAGNGFGDSDRSNALTLFKNGTLMIAGTLHQSSDIRLKLDIQPLDDVTARVRGITPIRYRFAPGTGHPDGPKIGLSAQDVRAAFPELVSEGPDGYLTVAYAELSAILVRAVQEQQDRIDRQDERIADIEERLARIEALLNGSR